MNRTTSFGHILGWTFGIVLLASAICMTFLPQSTWQGHAGALWIGSFLLLLALGFLLSRAYHEQSPVFRLLRQFGRFQTSGSLDDLCIVNAGVCGILGLFFILLALFERTG